MIQEFSRFRPVCLIVLCTALALSLTACGGRQGNTGRGLTSESGETPDELVAAPTLPADDGTPLSRLERAAMDSIGVLDASLTAAERPFVERHFKFFVHTQRRSFDIYLKRSEPYLAYVKHVFTSRGIPEEVAYLAFVESGFNPNAVSRAGACGMWQFMPYTGKKYGLTQTGWIDERRDPFKATHSAADYLLKLHGDFGDWLLAVAAYNAGEGKIGRALAGTGSKSFFELCRNNHMLDDKAQLRDETMQYVPRLLAIAKIMRNLDALGFSAPDTTKGPGVVPVTVRGGTDLKGLAKTAGVTWDQFKAANPAYRRAVSPPDQTTTAYVPAAAEQKSLAWLDRKESRIYASWKDYKVKNGDSLSGIASRHGTTVALIKQANNKNNNLIKPGETLLVPAASQAAKLAAANASPKPAKKANGAYSGTHTIAQGDTLYALALQWNTTVDAVCKVNGITPKSRLQLGQTLYIPASGTPRAATVTEARAKETVPKGDRQSAFVTVRQGDTLYSLARSHNMSVDALCAMNKITAKTPLKVGQKLRIAGSPATSREQYALVRQGDTLSALARRNNTTVGVLMELNGLDDPGAIRQGQRIRLY